MLDASLCTRKPTRTERRVLLVLATGYAQTGEHELARATFALLGIQYVPACEVSL